MHWLRTVKHNLDKAGWEPKVKRRLSKTKEDNWNFLSRQSSITIDPKSLTLYYQPFMCLNSALNGRIFLRKVHKTTNGNKNCLSLFQSFCSELESLNDGKRATNGEKKRTVIFVCARWVFQAGQPRKDKSYWGKNRMQEDPGPDRIFFL